MNHPTAVVIAIDGPGGAGKGTIAKRVAMQLGFHLLDSGALYRLLAIAATNHGVDLDDAEAVQVIAEHLDVTFDNEGIIRLEGQDVTREIRTEEVGSLASQVAALPEARAALLTRQRAFQVAPGLVADGRDMGTVVFRDAPLKIFLTASVEARAERRYKQLLEQGFDASLAALQMDIQARDQRDTTRITAPLRPAEDAVQIDSTELGIEEVVEQVMAQVKARKLV